jgi:hypothetical protein
VVLLLLVVAAGSAAAWLFSRVERLEQDLALSRQETVQARAEAEALQQRLAAARRQAESPPPAPDPRLTRELEEARAALQALQGQVQQAEQQAREATARAESLRGQLEQAQRKGREAAAQDRPPREGPAGQPRPPAQEPAEAEEADADGAESYEAIDRHALQAPAQAEASVEALAAYLARPARTRRQKARAFYRWITDRVAYDAEGLLSGQFGDLSPQGVLARRKAVCDGYANLFARLCSLTGVEAVKVPGSAKGYDYVPGSKTRGSAHAWNAVKLGGRWHLLDATWGAGHLTSGKFVKRFDDFFFLPPPEELIFTHLPNDPHWQLLTPPLSAQDFEAQVKVPHAVFKLGWTAANVREAMRQPGFRDVVKVAAFAGQLRVVQAPVQRHLRAGVAYTFRFESAEMAAMALSNNRHWLPCAQRGTVFEATVRPEPGLLRISSSRTPVRPGGTMQGVLEYVVEAGP